MSEKVSHTPRQGIHGYVCPECRTTFFQPFVCTTCGALKLHNHTMAVLERENTALRQQRGQLAAELQAFLDANSKGPATEWIHRMGECDKRVRALLSTLKEQEHG